MKYKQLLALVALTMTTAPVYATSVDLDFSNHIEATNLSNSFGPSYALSQCGYS